MPKLKIKDAHKQAVKQKKKKDYGKLWYIPGVAALVSSAAMSYLYLDSQFDAKPILKSAVVGIALVALVYVQIKAIDQLRK